MLTLAQAFTARALGVAWNKYQESLGVAPYLGRTFFGTDKKIGLELRFIKGRKGLPVALKGSSFDALAPLRDAIGFKDIQNEMPFFRESYMVSEKDEQEYMNYISAENSALANQVLKEIMKNPMDLILGADVVPERMIWQLLAPANGIPKIDVVVDGGDVYAIDYTSDNGVEYKSKNFKEVKGTSQWKNASTATPIQDMVDLQEQHRENRGEELTTFVMNQKTWKQVVNAEDTHKQVQGILAYQNGIMLQDKDVKNFLLDNYGITVLVYNKMYIGEDGNVHTFIPDGVVTAVASTATSLGTVWYGTTPEERSGSETDGSLSIVNTGVAVYTYATNHPINTHCVVSEIVLPSYENMDSVCIMNVNAGN
jgi:hypothetical protein